MLRHVRRDVMPLAICPRALPLLLQDSLLRLPQVIIGGSISFRLMRRQRNMLAQLAQKLAFAAAEAVRIPSGRYQNAEHTASHPQRGDHQSTKPAAAELLRKWRLDYGDIGLMDQLTFYATAQTVLIDGEPLVLPAAIGFRLL